MSTSLLTTLTNALQFGGWKSLEALTKELPGATSHQIAAALETAPGVQIVIDSQGVYYRLTPQ